MLDQDLNLQTSSAESVEIERKPVFLADLFKEKIFGESSLAQPIRRIALSRNRTVLAAQVLSLLIVLVGGGGLAISYGRLSQQEDELNRFLIEEEADLKKIEAYYVGSSPNETLMPRLARTAEPQSTVTGKR